MILKTRKMICWRYIRYKGKIEEIRELNPKGYIFICPVLPSHNRVLTQKINDFNRYLFSDLQTGNLMVNIVEGFNDGVLKNILHDKRTPTDVVHINNRGYSILVKLIKQAIFSVKSSKNKVTTGRLFRRG